MKTCTVVYGSPFLFSLSSLLCLSLSRSLYAHDLSLPSNSLKRRVQSQFTQHTYLSQTLLIAPNTRLLKNSSWKICYKYFTIVFVFPPLKPIFNFLNYDKNNFLSFFFLISFFLILSREIQFLKLCSIQRNKFVEVKMESVFWGKFIGAAVAFRKSRNSSKRYGVYKEPTNIGVLRKRG